MKTLVVVITHPEAQSQIDHNSPSWAKSGADVMGVEHENKPPMQWPAGIPVVQIGTDPDHEPNHYMGRLLRVMQYVLSTNHDRYCFIEADVIFLRPIPEYAGSDLPTGTLAGFRNQGFKGKCFWHCPWLFLRSHVEVALDYSQRLIEADITERGTIDRFLGLLGDLYPAISFRPSKNYSRNTIYPADLADARKCITQNTWAVHGVKSREVYQALIKL